MSSTRAIAFGGLLTALHLIVLWLMQIIPALEFFMVLGMPLLSAYYSYYFHWKPSLTFALATAILTALINPLLAIMWIWPALVIGLFYGALVRYRFGAIRLVITMTWLHSFSLYGSLLILAQLVNYDVIEQIRIQILHMSVDLFRYLAPTLLLIYGLGQSFVTHLIMSYEFKRLNIAIEVEKSFSYQTVFSVLSFYIISFLVSLLLPPSSLILWSIVMSFFMMVPLIVYSYKTIKMNWLLRVIQSMVFLFIFIPLLGILKDHTSAFLGMILLPFFPLVIVYGFRHYTTRPFSGKITKKGDAR